MGDVNSLNQPNHNTEATPAEGTPPHDDQVGVPTENSLRWPLVLALRDLGGSAHINDVEERVSSLLQLTDQQTSSRVPSGGGTRLRNRLNWAGFDLKKLEIITYPSRGHRELSDLGHTITEPQLDALFEDMESPSSNAPRRPPLESRIEDFLKETGYPTEADEEQKRLREEWAEKLKPENIPLLSWLDLSAVTNEKLYRTSAYICRMTQESKFVEKHDTIMYESLLRSVEYLCWGEGELAARFDEVDDRSVKEGDVGGAGFVKISGGFCSKLLAVCHPDRFLPIAGQDQGRMCRKAALELLGLPSPTGKNFWYKSVNANDTLRDHLEPHFRDDLYGMARFVYWLMDHTPESSIETKNDSNPPIDVTGHPPRHQPNLSSLANDLLIGVDLLNDIVDLLNDKGQVILYGPPGTGKTYLTQALAKELAPNESRRALVQFHPSTSYEDFFEGYRPAGNTADGSIRYELTPGPLARMAERASEPPGKQHIMVIDEINRGNLPRVLGELLLLLEYRGESIHPLYRPEEQFSLPANLWFIGTMNTADRSIALVDAALRRRFHFVPFFPDREPIAGLLGRWLKRNSQPEWVGNLVDAVNGELATDLEGSHLLLGPSHFMKNYGSTSDDQRERLRRIWKYNIEPFIEDQFFGNPDRIQHYRFADVLDRHGPATQAAADDGGAPSGTAPSAPPDSARDDSTAETAEIAAGETVSE